MDSASMDSMVMCLERSQFINGLERSQLITGLPAYLEHALLELLLNFNHFQYPIKTPINVMLNYLDKSNFFIFNFWIS